MGIIWKLVCRHMKLERKRVFATMICVAISVILFLYISGAMFAGVEIMKEAETEQNGAYHVRFRGITKEQSRKIAKHELVTKCQWTDSVENSGAEGGCAEVIFAQVDDSIFAAAQELAERIGMAKIPEEEQTEYLPNGEKLEYDITYHYDLLTLYGVSNPDGAGVSVYKVGIGILIVLSIVFAAFIYNSFEVSLYEGRKYLGLLECVGATAMQKGMFLFMEAIFIGVISILAGAVLGSVSFAGIWKMVQAEVQTEMSLSSPVQFQLNSKMIMIAVVFGLVTVILACVIPVCRASACTVAELLRNEKEKDFQIFKARRYDKRRSLEWNLALRNLQCGKKKTMTTILVLAAAAAFVLNGFVWIHMSEGDYLLQDRREKIAPDKWVSIFSEDSDTYERAFQAVREQNPKGNTWSVSSLSVGSIVFPKDILRVKKDEFELYGLSVSDLPGRAEDAQGTVVTGYGFDTVLVGLDEKSFDAYSRKIGISKKELEKGKKQEYPFIIENYLLTDQSGQREYDSIMKEEQGKTYTVSFSKYGDLNMDYASRVDVLVNADFYVIGATGQRPDIPVSQEDYEYHVEAESQVSAGTIYLYTYMDKFNELIGKDEFRNMIGIHPEETVAESYTEYNEVSRRIYFSSKEDMTDSEWREKLSPTLGNEKLFYEKDNTKNDRNTWTFSSRNMIDTKKKSNPVLYFRTVFYYGILLMVIVFVLSGMFQYLIMGLRVRKKEFAVLESLGMTRTTINHMICIENIIPVLIAGVTGIVAGIAAILGQFREAGQYQAVEIRIPFGVILGLVLVLALFLSSVLVVGVHTSKETDLVNVLKNE